MVELRDAPPPWMGAWLNTPMYGENCRCDKHKTNYTTVFCGKCMGSPHCQTCWEDKESMHHPNDEHSPILQAYVASRRLAIRVESISREWDVSDIQIYTINGRDVLHLDTNGNSVSPLRRSRNSRGKKEEIPKCKQCRRRIKESNYSFCSIACKYYHVTGLDREMEQNVIQVPLPPPPRPPRPLPPPPSLRKRHRKGIPSRAPFF